MGAENRHTGVLTIGNPTVDLPTKLSNLNVSTLPSGKKTSFSTYAGVLGRLFADFADPTGDLGLETTGQATAAGNVTNVTAAINKLSPKSSYNRPIIKIGTGDGHEATIRAHPALTDAIVTEHKGPNSVSIVVTAKEDPDRDIISFKSEIPGGFEYDGDEPQAIYLTSGGTNWRQTYPDVTSYAKKHKDVLLAVSPGSQEMKDKGPELYETITHATVLFANKEEALSLIGEDPETSTLPIDEILIKTKKLGPQVISITDGANGSYTIDDQNIYHLGVLTPTVLPELSHTIVNTLGAGDAYAAAFFQALIENLGIEEAMRWGTLNAAFVIRTEDANSGQLIRAQMIDYAKRIQNDFRPTISNHQALQTRLDADAILNGFNRR
ncbi:carbohydrate kinase family protein [Candidatus Gottesmanbacteria bacterium]|nr:carbohydrate kinase family protein [Candidatus Gottesmanbacteria bacterium]